MVASLARRQNRTYAMIAPTIFCVLYLDHPILPTQMAALDDAGTSVVVTHDPRIPFAVNMSFSLQHLEINLHQPADLSKRWWHDQQERWGSSGQASARINRFHLHVPSSSSTMVLRKTMMPCIIQVVARYESIRTVKSFPKSVYTCLLPDGLSLNRARSAFCLS